MAGRKPRPGLVYGAHMSVPDALRACHEYMVGEPAQIVGEFLEFGDFIEAGCEDLTQKHPDGKDKETLVYIYARDSWTNEAAKMLSTCGQVLQVDAPQGTYFGINKAGHAGWWPVESFEVD